MVAPDLLSLVMIRCDGSQGGTMRYDAYHGEVSHRVRAADEREVEFDQVVQRGLVEAAH